MTFFLPTTPADPLPARGADTPLPTWWDGLGAHWSATALERNANMRASREERDSRIGAIDRAVSVFGEQAALDVLRESQPMLDVPASRVGEVIRRDSRLQERVLEAMRADAAARPDAYQGLDLSEEGLTTQANAVLQAEYQDAQDMIALTDSGSAAALGSLAGGVADVRNLAVMVPGLGQGGTFLRVVGREAALNAAAEAAFLPSQFDMAERLEIADPNVIRTLAEAAAAGAVLGGAVEAVARGLTYYRGTRARPQTTLHPAEEQMLVDRAEDVLAQSPTPFEDIQASVAEVRAERRAEAVAERPPLILRAEDRVGVPAGTSESSVSSLEPSVAPAEPGSSAAPEPAVPREDFEPDPEAVRALDEAEADFVRRYPNLRPGRSGSPRPFSRWIRGRGGIAWTRQTSEGERVLTWAAQELQNRGVTQRMAVGVQNRRGSGDLDNLDADDPDVAQLLGNADDPRYLDREAIIDALARELSGEGPQPTSLSMKMDMEAMEALRSSTFARPAEDFMAKRQSPEGFFVREEDYDGPDGFERLGADLDAYLGQRWSGVRFSPQEREEMLDELWTNGGDGAYLVERVLERELEFAEVPRSDFDDEWTDAPAGELPETGGGDPGGTGQAAGAARGGGEGAPGDPLASERTAAGDQTLVPGVAPVSTRERLEARMGKALAGKARAADEGLFDLGARSQMDWLDDSSGANPVQDQRIADLRRREDDPEIMTPDGVTMRLSAALDDLDAGDDFVGVLASCGVRRPTSVPL